MIGKDGYEEDVILVWIGDEVNVIGRLEEWLVWDWLMKDFKEVRFYG